MKIQSKHRQRSQTVREQKKNLCYNEQNVFKPFNSYHTITAQTIHSTSETNVSGKLDSTEPLNHIPNWLSLQQEKKSL